MIKNFLFFILILIFMPVAVKSFSMPTLPDGIQEQFSVEFSNNNPGPNQDVNVRVTSFSTDFNRTTITWQVDGAIILSGTGARDFSFRTKDLGQNTQLRVIINKQNGERLQRTYNFRPSKVDIIYEARTETPPFYQGRALFTEQAAVRIFAVPLFLNSNGVRIPEQDLVYNWSVNGRVDQARSGYGRDFFDYEGSVITRPLQIGVTVSTVDNSSRSRANLTITPTRPIIVFYEKNPVYGTIYEQAILGSYLLERREVEIEAFPYFFASNDTLSYNWKVNGRNVGTSGTRFMVFGNEENETGRATISLDISGIQRILQNGTNNFSLFFGEDLANVFNF